MHGKTGDSSSEIEAGKKTAVIKKHTPPATAVATAV